MSGDVQPRKRKDKRRKKDDTPGHEEPSIQAAATPTGNEDFNIHVHNDHGTGGGICAKLVFFVLLSVLAVLIGMIFIEKRGLTDLDTAPTESRFANIFDGWIETEHDDDHHDHIIKAIEDHDDHEAEEASVEEGHDDEHEDHDDEHEDEHEETEEQEDEEQVVSEEAEEEEEQEVVSEEAEEEDEQQVSEEAEEEAEEETQEESQEVEAEEEQQESEEDEEEQHESEEDQQEVSEEKQEEEEDEIPTLVDEIEDDVEENEPQISEDQADEAGDDNEDDAEDTNEDNEQEDEDDNTAEGEDDNISNPEEENNDDETDFDTVSQENEIFEEDSAENPADVEGDDQEEEEEEVIDNTAGEEEVLKVEAEKQEEAEQEESSSMAVKFGVGVALVVVAHVVLVRKWRSGKSDDKPSEEEVVTDLSRRNTIVPPAPLELIENDIQNVDEDEYSEEEIEESEEEIIIEPVPVKKNYQELHSTYSRTLPPENLTKTTFENLNTPPKRTVYYPRTADDEEEVEEEEEEDNEEVEDEEEVEEGEDVEEGDEGEEPEEEEISDVDDEELLKKLEARYGKLPSSRDNQVDDKEKDDKFGSWKKIKVLPDAEESEGSEDEHWTKQDSVPADLKQRLDLAEKNLREVDEE